MMSWQGNIKNVYSLTDGPCVTWQLGQWYKSISAALSSSTSTQLHKKKTSVKQFADIAATSRNDAITTTITFMLNLKK